ncbi:MAG: hypothetical protein CMN75_00540 [Spirochaeta sp.]|nr:hypothetical protein [Spirochaeta sp.]
MGNQRLDPVRIPKGIVSPIYLPQKTKSHHSFLKAEFLARLTPERWLRAGAKAARPTRKKARMGWEYMRSISRDSVLHHTLAESGPAEPSGSGLQAGPQGRETRSQSPSTRRTLMAWLLVTLLLTGAGTANAYTLAELIDDQTSFSSLNQTVTFSEFTLDTTGIDQSFLELYEVIPNRFGFWVFSPDYGPTDPSEIGFSYQVEAAAGLNINGLTLSMTRLEEADMDATADMWVENISGALLAELDVAIQNGTVPGCSAPCTGRYDSDWTAISAANKLQISESIGSGVIPPAEWKLSQKFFTEPVPEPSTALLLGLGLAGVALRRRSRLH